MRACHSMQCNASPDVKSRKLYQDLSMLIQHCSFYWERCAAECRNTMLMDVRVDATLFLGLTWRFGSLTQVSQLLLHDQPSFNHCETPSLAVECPVSPATCNSCITSADLQGPSQIFITFGSADQQSDQHGSCHIESSVTSYTAPQSRSRSDIPKLFSQWRILFNARSTRGNPPHLDLRFCASTFLTPATSPSQPSAQAARH